MKKLEHYPARKVEEALRKLKKIRRYEGNLKKYRSRYGIKFYQHSIHTKETETRALKSCGVARTTLFRWRQKYYKDGLIGLIDTRGGSRKRGHRRKRKHQG